MKGFGLQRGAFATTVAHDAHNIVCVGVSDEDMALCVGGWRRSAAASSRSRIGACAPSSRCRWPG